MHPIRQMRRQTIGTRLPANPTEADCRAALDAEHARLAALRQSELATELQSLHNARLSLDPLIVAAQDGDRVAAHEALDQVIDALHAGRELPDAERGYLLVPFGLLTIQQVRALVPDATPSLSTAAAD